MSILAAPAPCLSPSVLALPHPAPQPRPTCRECGADAFHRIGCPVEHETTCRVLPEDCRPVQAAEPEPYSPEDAAWWAEHCDHEGWVVEGELSPEERDAELEWADLRKRGREAMEADWVERYSVM